MGTHHRGTREEVRALNAYITLMRAAGSVQGALDPALAASGLTESQFGILEEILHLGPLSPCDLGRKGFQSGGNVTVVLDNLERRGLVERRRDVADRRRVTVHLTAPGRRLVKAVFPDQVRRIVAAMSHLEPSEQDELARLAKKLGLAVREAPREPRRG